MSALSVAVKPPRVFLPFLFCYEIVLTYTSVSTYTLQRFCDVYNIASRHTRTALYFALQLYECINVA